MPAEPDNKKIEELVKAYAQKRREQAGQSFEIHPATRKMLQGEITRQKPPATERRATPLALLLRFWPRLVFGSAMVAVLSMVLWNVSQHPNPSEERLKFAKTSDDDLKRGSKDAVSDRMVDESLSPAGNSPARRPVLRDLQRAPERKGAKEAEARLQSELDLAKREEASVPANTDSFMIQRAMKPAAQPSVSAEVRQRDDLKKDGSIRQLKEVDGLELARQVPAAPVNDRKLSLGRDGEVKNGADANRLGVVQFGIAPAPVIPSPKAPGALPSERFSEVTENRGYTRVETAPKIAQAPLQAKSYLSVTDRPAPDAAAAFGREAGSQSGLGQANEVRLGFNNKFSPASGPVSEPKPAGQAGSTALGYGNVQEFNRKDPVQAKTFYGGLNGATPGLATAVPAGNPLAPPPSLAVDSISAALDSKRAELPAQNAGFGDQYFRYAVGGRIVRSRFSNVVPQSKLDDASGGTIAVEKKSKALNEPLTTTAQPLGSTFDFEQNGDQIKIVDSDGSIYEGIVLLTTAEKNKEAIQNPEPTKASDQSAWFMKLGELSQPSFTASGTNRTSRKFVVVKGLVLTDLPESELAGAGVAPRPDKTEGIKQQGLQPARGVAPAGELSKAAAQPDPGSATAGAKTATELVRAGRIQGTVRIDKTNLLRFDAVRQSP